LFFLKTVKKEDIKSLFKKSINKQIRDKIVEYSIENTSGLIMSKRNILKLVNECLPLFETFTTYKYIDEQMVLLESRKGFLVKASDVYSAIENLHNYIKI
jgi:hypothetical protein